VLMELGEETDLQTLDCDQLIGSGLQGGPPARSAAKGEAAAQWR
jgi:hypothetical protein